MNSRDFYKSLELDRSALDEVGFNPYYRPLNGLQHGQPWIDRSPHFDLASNDYLGLASDGRIHGAMAAAIREYGSSMCGTPIATGYASVLAQLERELARFIGLPAAVIFPSCYQANVALLSTLAKAGDVIFIDHYAHASLGQGAKASGCKVKPFLHNDVEHLQKLLAASGGFKQRFVVTESVFSTEGSISPLRTILDVANHYDAIPVVDDSHGLGVIGSSGRGILEHAGIEKYSGVYTASLGKALANAGGVVAGDADLVEALRYTCPGLIYSTALAPALVAGTLAALDIIQEEFGRLGDLMWSNHGLLIQWLQRQGYALVGGQAPIASILSGSTDQTLGLARDFYARRVLATPFVPPSVPQGKGVLRCILGAKLQGFAVHELFRALGDRAASTPAAIRGRVSEGVLA